MADTRSRLALYQATAAKRRSNLRELDDKLAGLPDQIEQARLDHLRRTPTKRSDALGSEVQKLRRNSRTLSGSATTWPRSLPRSRR